MRERAIRLAARYVEPQVLGTLVADEVNAVRRNAAIAALERQGPYAVPHLESMLGPADDDVVMFALQVLARIGEPAAVPGRPAAAPPPRRQRRAGRHRGAGPAPAPARRSPPCSSSWAADLWLQLAAIDALGEIGDPEAVGPLLALVPDTLVAEPAVQALQRIAAPGVAGAPARPASGGARARRSGMP